MTTPPQAPAPERNFGSYVDFLTRLTTALLVVIYSIGFVILTVYEAHYGISQFSPLRARIFLVGFVFTALAALPAAAHHYGLSYYGPLTPVLENSDPALERYRRVVLGSGFIYTAYWMAATFSLFLFQSAPPTEHTHPRLRFAAFALSYAVLLFVYSLIGKRFARHPKASAVFAGLASAVFVAGQYAFGAANIANLTVWFFVAASAWLDVRRNPNRLRYVLDFRNWFFMILTVFMYVFSLFGDMRSELGGGSPTPVVMYLERPVALLDATIAEVAILDETDQGFYVLPSGKTKALFVPRGNVRSIYFGPVQGTAKPK